MNDPEERQSDQEPGPVKESDAEMLSGEKSQEAAEEIEDDPSRNPPQSELRETKGG